MLRNLIDQQLWLAKGKELGITGETELVNRLNDIRKQYNLATMEDLEKAAKEQGVSFEDFKANIRNQIITQEVMRDQVGRKIAPTPGEVQRYFEAHKQDYAQPESVKLGEILISTGSQPDDQKKLAAAKAKADDIEARLHAGGDFSQLARSFSEGTTAAEGGDLGQYKRGQLDIVFEEKTFALKTGEVTEPIRTKQGYVILKVIQHIPGGMPQFKDVENDVEQNYFEAKAGPAMRAVSWRNCGTRRPSTSSRDTRIARRRLPKSIRASLSARIRRPQPRRSGKWSAPASARPRTRSGRSRPRHRRPSTGNVDNSWK